MSITNRLQQQAIGSIHSSHIMKTFTGVTNDTNEGSVPFWSNRVRVLILCMLAHWKHSVTPVGLQLGSRDPHGLPNGPIRVCNSESVQMEPNGPVRVETTVLD